MFRKTVFALDALILLVVCPALEKLAPVDNTGWILAGVVVCYNIACFQIVGPTELGAILLFGKPVKEVSSGLVFTPFGLTTLVRETKLVFLEQYPAPPEKVWKGDEDKLPEGMVPPIRITHQGQGSDDPLSRRMTSEIIVIVRYKIEDFVTFFSTVGFVSEMRKQIKEITIAKAREIMAKKTPAGTLAELEVVNDCLTSEVRQIVQSWGVQVLDVKIEDLDLGHKVNKSLRDVPASELEALVTITRANAEQERLIREGAGIARARQLLLEAEALGYKKIAQELGLKEGEVVLAIDAIRESLSNGNQLIISGNNGLADIIQMGKALTATKGGGNNV